jgi:hypothetical protein
VSIAPVSLSAILLILKMSGYTLVVLEKIDSVLKLWPCRPNRYNRSSTENIYISSLSLNVV